MNQSPMRVLFAVPCLSVGGAERHVVTLLPEMDRNKFTPSLICIGEEGPLFPDLQRAGVDASALNSAGMRNVLRALRKLVAMMRCQKPDVVVMRGYNAEMLGRIAALLAGVRTRIVWVHNIGDTAPRGWIRKVADRALMPSTSAYFGVADAQTPYIVNDHHCPDAKVHIIRNGVDPARFDFTDDRAVLTEFGIDSDDPVVGIVAGLRPEKDHATLLHAARIVLNHLPRARFLIIGDGVLRADLELLCTKLGIESNVYFVGVRGDVGQLLRAIDVFTLSSFTVECFPFALLEAMACARPAVCTDVGGIGEMVEEGVSGYLVPPRDPEQLATRLQELLENPVAARRMGRAGRSRAETHFSLERSVRAAEQAIAEVSARSDAGSITRIRSASRRHPT